jgi:transmembrane 9 superfamily member 2/4
MAPFLSSLLLAASLWTTATSAFYLPGVAPTDYQMSQKVPLNVNRLTPAMNENDESLKSLIPYDYYYKRFQFCKPHDGPKQISESLGSILFGDRIMTSPFDLHMGKNETCKVLCSTEYDKKNAKFMREKIQENYYYNWLIDGLPAASWRTDRETKRDYHSVGFPLGTYVADDEHVDVALNNHYDIIIEYHEVKERKAYRVVGVLVQPASISSKDLGDGRGDCSDHTVKVLKEDSKVVYTYSVYWKASSTPWATRWDKYLQVDQPQIHWFFLIDAAVLVFFLTGLVATTLLRALRKDIAKYNQFDLDEDVHDDSGWKLLHGDVFRTPKNPLLLSIFLGSGAQLFFMTGATISKTPLCILSSHLF